MLFPWRWTVWRKEENQKEQLKRAKKKARTPKQKEKVGTASRACAMTNLQEKEKAKERARTAPTAKESQKEKDSRERKLVSTVESLDIERLDCWKNKKIEEKVPGKWTSQAVVHNCLRLAVRLAQLQLDLRRHRSERST